MKYTPTPWEAFESNQGTPCIRGSAHEWIVTLSESGLGKNLDRANRDFIVRACNAHDELVASIKKALDECVDLIGTNAGKALEEALAQAREILRTIKVQLQIVAQGKRNVPTDVIDFAEKP